MSCVKSLPSADPTHTHLSLCQESTARGGPSYGNSEINDMARPRREISLIPLDVCALDFLAVPDVSKEEQIDFSFPARH